MKLVIIKFFKGIELNGIKFIGSKYLYKNKNRIEQLRGENLIL